VCTQFLLKGVVQQKEGWLHNTTEVKVSVKEGATTTCNGESFSSASAFSASRNGSVAIHLIRNDHFPEGHIERSPTSSPIFRSCCPPSQSLATPHAQSSLNTENICIMDACSAVLNPVGVLLACHLTAYCPGLLGACTYQMWPTRLRGQSRVQPPITSDWPSLKPSWGWTLQISTSASRRHQTPLLPLRTPAAAN
jgi:hypothetical protein